MSDFDPDKYLSENDLSQKLKQNGGFDPDAYLKKTTVPKTSILDAATNHFADTLLGGYEPQIVAGLTKGAIGLHNMFSDNEIAQPDYTNLRDEVRGEIDKSKEEHPWASGVGTAAGIVGTIPLVAGKAVQGASMLSKLGQAAKTGATLGAIQNPGDVEGEINPVQLGDRLKNGLIGGAVGLGGQALSETVPSALKNVSSYFNDNAEKSAYKALQPFKRAVKQDLNSGQIQNIGRQALDEGILKGMPSTETMLERVGKLKSEKGGELDEILKYLSQKGEEVIQNKGSQFPAPDGFIPNKSGVSRKSIADSLRNDLLNSNVDISGVTKRNNFFNKAINNYENGGDDLLSILANEEKKRATSKLINFDRLPGADIPIEEEFNRALLSKLKKGTEDAADYISGNLGEDIKGSFKNVKNQYGSAKSAERILKDRIAAEESNKFLNLKDSILSAGGGVAGFSQGDDLESRIKNGIMGATMGYGSKALARGMRTAPAKTFDGIAKTLESIPRFAKLLNLNPEAFKTLTQRMTSRMTGEGSFEAIPALSPKLLQNFQNNPELVDSLTNEKLKERIKKELDKNRVPSNEKLIPENEAQQMFLKGN